MIILAEVDEQAMVQAFIDAEHRHPNKRGYKKRKGLFAGFPRDCRWLTASLTEAELKQVSHLRNNLTWLALGGLLREPAASAAWMKTHENVVSDTHDYRWRMVRGEFPAFPVVLVGPLFRHNPRPDKLVVLEGNNRVLAACMGGVAVDRLPVLIGVSKNIKQWKHYRDSKKLRKALTPVRLEKQ